jgi:hypothetical protein
MGFRHNLFTTDAPGHGPNQLIVYAQFTSGTEGGWGHPGREQAYIASTTSG